MSYTIFLALIAFVGFVLLAAVKSILVDDIKSFAPKVAHYILRKAAYKLDSNIQGQYYEMWLADFNDTPETTAKLWNALTLYLYGARQITELHKTGDRSRPFYSISKRIFDVAFVLPGFAIFLAPFLVYAAIVKISGGQLFDNEKIVGIDGKIVTLHKLNVKSENYNDIVAAYLKANPNPTDCEISKFFEQGIGLSPRGKILRKFGLNVGPMTYDVLIGNFSVIGPAPVREIDRHTLKGSLYSKQKPGWIGVWVEHVNTLDDTDLLALEDQYYLNRSFINDAKFIIKFTIAGIMQAIKGHK